MHSSSVCFVLILTPLTWKLSWDPPTVTLIQFSSTADDIVWVLFAIWLRRGPASWLRMLLDSLGSFSLRRRLVLRGSLMIRVQANDFF